MAIIFHTFYIIHFASDYFVSEPSTNFVVVCICKLSSFDHGLIGSSSDQGFYVAFTLDKTTLNKYIYSGLLACVSVETEGLEDVYSIFVGILKECFSRLNLVVRL